MNIVRWLRSLAGERGQSIAEFALVVPLLLWLSFGILEFGQVIQNYIVVTSGAREGARYGATGASASEIASKVQQATTLPASKLAVQVTNARGPQGTAVTVQVSYPVQIHTPLIATAFGQNVVSVSSTAVMRLE